MKYLIMVLLLVMVIPFTPAYRNQLAHINDIQKEEIKGQSSIEETPEPIPKEEIECLSRNIYHEARGEGHVGMTAIAMVTLNRVKDPRWPKTVCKVVYQPYQFSWTHQKVKVKDKNGRPKF
jgi:spore germination cell wall hydrolase CwlJ-like protein